MNFKRVAVRGRGIFCPRHNYNRGLCEGSNSSYTPEIDYIYDKPISKHHVLFRSERRVRWPEEFESNEEFEGQEEEFDPRMGIDDPLSKTGGTIDPRGGNG
ncbi:hypothetical protein BST85_05390 [Aureitalea marina]|uniref:Uncharacterized protein n=1 Tax=Aureitalea marina TaxID=930804 RepID=A0A2S7KP41_9FLAO|nr:hypothetical protein BST85_05390 [Aureitalea marina]